MRVEATKFLVSTAKIIFWFGLPNFWSVLSNLVVLTKKLVTLTKNLVAPTKNFVVLAKNLVASTLIIFQVCLTKNEGQLNQNFVQPNQIAIWLSQPLQRVGSAYKISMSVHTDFDKYNRYMKLYFQSIYRLVYQTARNMERRNQ